MEEEKPSGAAESKGYRDGYLFALTDDTGMIQHSKYSVPDPQHGYSTDDNARAFLLAAELAAHRPERREAYLPLARRYLSFLRAAQREDGSFHNFLGWDRCWLDETGSEDTLGRAVWGLGAGSAVKSLPSGLRCAALSMLKQSLPRVHALHFVKSQAYALLGLTALYRGGGAEGLSPQDQIAPEEILSCIRELTEKLLQALKDHTDGAWHWFEDCLTYSNGLVPWSLLTASELPGLADAAGPGFEALDFLGEKTIRSGLFAPVGCQGWWPKGAEEGALYDQQPLEAYEMMGACRLAGKKSGDARYRRWEEVAFSWYLGRNVGSCPLIDEETGGCYDGLTAGGVNGNLGAESQIAWGLSCLLG